VVIGVSLSCCIQQSGEFYGLRFQRVECVAVSCSELQRVAVCCSVLQCVEVCCSVLQCIVLRCSVLHIHSGGVSGFWGDCVVLYAGTWCVGSGTISPFPV